MFDFIHQLLNRPFGANSNRKIVRMGLIDAGAAAEMVEKICPMRI